jgi:hypothetical protein
MALELTIFALLLGIAGIIYLLGLFSKTQFLFLLGCVLLGVTGASLFIFDGLITNHYYDVAGVLQSVIVTSSNLSLWVVALVLIAIGLISLLVFDFAVPSKQKSPFHY